MEHPYNYDLNKLKVAVDHFIMNGNTEKALDEIDKVELNYKLYREEIDINNDRRFLHLQKYNIDTFLKSAG